MTPGLHPVSETGIWSQVFNSYQCGVLLRSWGCCLPRTAFSVMQ